MKGGFGGMGGMGNMQKLLKQAQKAQADIAKAQAEISEMEVEASSGGGAVKVKVKGNFELLSLKIDPSAVEVNDMEMLEDLILAAINTAVSDIKKKSEEIMSKAAGPMAGMMF